ncbi:DinB family protein [Ornithinibacillus bavariensis]|uniref:Formate dehydrogenase n=1 Tax=Ornithinibacillus bavariensis TaxID=545502 RepID=A0A919X549_9BACI|nr:DinB family protein [Ornithinibacillus bavariensis]GIO25894.1 formate dehydrogenase [Ornithinibacillus bavariensis]
MSVLKQFNLTRTSLLTFLSELDEEALDKKTNYFDNTIRWYIGNTLFMDEKLLFVSKQSRKLPEEYAQLFSSDILSSEWTIKAPSLEQLINDLEDQQNRINNFDEFFWKSNVKFKVPYGHVETHGDLLIMLAHREAEILGRMKAMKQVVEAE